MKSRSWLRLVFALVAGLLATLPAPSGAQVPRPRPKPDRSQATRPAMSQRARALPSWRHVPDALPAVTATISESEPNDSLALADSVAQGDTVSGTIAPAADADWFTLAVPSDTIIVLDVYARRAGSSLDPVLYLFALADTGVIQIAHNDDFYGLDSHIQARVTAGRYYAALVDYDRNGGTGYTYAISFTFVPPFGPGDPTTVYASGVGSAYGTAAGPAGQLYVTDPDARRVLRVDAGGTVAPLASLSGFEPLHAVVDGLGNVLVTALDTDRNVGVVERIGPGGAVTTFASGFSWVAGITVGQDGDIWMLGINDRIWLYRFDPVGTRKDSIDVSGLLGGFLYTASHLAFSPSGELHFSNGYDAVFALVNRTPRRVISAVPYAESLAFDRDGYLYVSNASGWVSLYDAAYNVVNASFARTNLTNGWVMSLSFARDANGAMTSRLFATSAERLVEMNPAGMRAPGVRVGTDLLAITPASLPAATVGADYRFALVVQSPPPGNPTWSISAGALPSGLTLDAATGVLSGVPMTSGNFTFTVRVSVGGTRGYNGYTLVVSLPNLSVDAAADHFLVGAQLDTVIQRFLDFQGNKNGRYDVGDFRAYLRTLGRLPTTTLAREARP